MATKLNDMTEPTRRAQKWKEICLSEYIEKYLYKISLILFSVVKSLGQPTEV